MIRTRAWPRTSSSTKFYFHHVFRGLPNHLGPKRLSQTVARLLTMVDPLVGKNSLHCLWASLHPLAIKFQQSRLLDFLET